MLIKKPHIGTRLGLGDVDPVQPLHLAHPLMRGVQGFWLPLPHLSGGGRLYDLSPYGRHGSLVDVDPGNVWSFDHKRTSPFITYNGEGQANVIDSPAWSLADAPSLTVFVHLRADVLDTFFQTIIASGEGSNWRIARSATSDNTIGFNIGSLGTSLQIGQFTGKDLFCFFSWDESFARTAVIFDEQVFFDGGSAGSPDTAKTLMIGNNPGATDRAWKGPIYSAMIKHSFEPVEWAVSMSQQARRGFPDLLNRRPSMAVVDMAVAPPPAGDTITATVDLSLAADYAATLQPTPLTLAATADLTLAQDYAAAIGTEPGAIQASADASLSADYAALLQPQQVTLAATPDASPAADHAGAIQPTPATLTASTDLTLGADYAATITEVDAPVVIQVSADPSIGADYAASVVAVPVEISIGFDASLGADFAAFLSDSSASQTVKARISTGERFTSNTSTSERVA